MLDTMHEVFHELGHPLSFNLHLFQADSVFQVECVFGDTFTQLLVFGADKRSNIIVTAGLNDLP